MKSSAKLIVEALPVGLWQACRHRPFRLYRLLLRCLSDLIPWRRDLDLLVEALPRATLLDLGDLEAQLTSLLGVDVDLLTPGDLPTKFREKVLAEARPV